MIHIRFFIQSVYELIISLFYFILFDFLQIFVIFGDLFLVQILKIKNQIIKRDFTEFVRSSSVGLAMGLHTFNILFADRSFECSFTSLRFATVSLSFFITLT